MEGTSGWEAGDCAAHERRQTKQRPMSVAAKVDLTGPRSVFGPGKLTFGSNFRSRGLELRGASREPGIDER